MIDARLFPSPILQTNSVNQGYWGDGKKRNTNGEEKMAVGLIAPPWLHTASLSSLVSWKRVQSPSRLSVRASSSSSWKHQVSKANDSPFKLSTVFLDILKESSESDLAALQTKDAEDRGTKSNNDSFIRRRRDSELEANRHSNQDERTSSTDTEEVDGFWSAEERRDAMAWDVDDEVSSHRQHSKPTTSKLYPSKYTKWKHPRRDDEDWETNNDNKSFIRRRRDSELKTIQEERASSTDAEVSSIPHRDYRRIKVYGALTSMCKQQEEDGLWSAEDRRDAMADEVTSLSRSYPSIPAKFSKYTKGKHPYSAQSRSVLVRQQQAESQEELQPYFKQKSVFFQDFVPDVIKPEQPCQFSYSEHPKVAPIGLREPVYSPFGPDSLSRPWTGKRPNEPSKRAPRQFDSFMVPPAAMTKVRYVEPPGPFREGTGPRLGRTREEILGEPLSKEEVRELVAVACRRRRQLDLGKDGLTHNMLDLLHRHWKRRRVCRIKCYGVPTVDMDNLCAVIEEKSGGKIIRRSKSILYVFRGRNYNWNTRPQIPLMLWKPPAPIYPPVVQRVPEGLSEEEADNLRALGRRMHCLCRLQKAGMYQHLVKMVKGAFEVDELVKVDCRELDRSDMKKIGAKLRDLVPCVPLSFDSHFMLLWRGSKSSQNEDTSAPAEIEQESDTDICRSQKDESAKDFVDAEAKNTCSLESSSDHTEIADLTFENELTSENEDQVSSKANTRDLVDRDQVTNHGSMTEFDRLWQDAMNSEEAVVLGDSVADPDSAFETVKSNNIDLYSTSNEDPDWNSTSNEEPDWDSTSNEEPDWDTTLIEEPSGTTKDSLRIRDELSEMDNGIEEDQSTGRDADVYNAEELLPSTLTDITIRQDELDRLCALRLKIRGWMKIGSDGITRGIVKSIHDKWLVSEIAKVRCIVPGCDMRQLHDDLERLTGGIVIWLEGPAVVIYRGKDYVPGWIRKFEEREEAYRERLHSLGLEDEEVHLSNEEQTFFVNIEELLDDLGPRCTEWTEGGHVPVDGDLLVPPESGFKNPFRRLPYGLRPRLTNLEMTEMRHLARKLPPHFALGKRRGLEGIATAIVKLWEVSEVVKVVMKRGVSRIDNDRMAAELMRLTGGDLIARNMTYIALFRGNDFLPSQVKRTLEEKNRMATTLLEEEERVRLAGFVNATPVVDAPLKLRSAGTLAETMEENSRWNHSNTDPTKLQNAARDQAFQRMQKLLNTVAHKIDRTERELRNLDLKVQPKTMTNLAKEQVSEEEMFTLRKIGMRMKPHLLLGRREVFGGIIENMHLNWKWRELVKIIVKKSYFMYREKDAVEKLARELETESGGVVVGICTIPVGEAIIVYRGKNYQRPTDGISPQGHPNGLRPPGLLTKRDAWQRFNQKRRKLALERHLQKLERDFDILRANTKRLEEENSESMKT